MSELDGIDASIWNTLRSTRPQSVNEFTSLPVLLDNVPSGIRCAMSADGRPHLLVPFDPSSSSQDPVNISLRGLILRETTLRLDGVDHLVVDASSSPAEEAMFTVVAKELARAVAIRGRDARSASVATVERWKKFWSVDRPPLSFTQKLGLFAELYLLNRLLIPQLGPTIVHAWKGPFGERHDFQADSWHIEAKASSKSIPVFRIHGHDQLDPPVNKDLLVFSLLASEESGAEDNIESEVDGIRGHLSAEVAELNAFEDALTSTGYHDIDLPIHLRVKSRRLLFSGQRFSESRN